MLRLFRELMFSAHRRRAAIAAAFATCVASVSFGATADTIKIGGTGAAETMLLQLGAKFESETGIAVKLLPHLGSTGGFRALADGVVDIAVSGRKPNSEETRKGVTIALSARTPFVFVTSNKIPDDIRSSELANIIESATPIWADGRPVRIILRPKTDSDTVLIGEYFPKAKDAIETARRRPGIVVAGTDGNNADLAETTQGSLTAAAYVQVATERRDLRLLSIDGIAPTLENFKSGKYPYEKLLHIIVWNSTSTKSERFIAYLRSPEALRLMHDAGLIPLGED